MSEAEVRFCSGCNETKPVENFGPSPSGQGGRLRRCKPCVAERSRVWREKNRERHRRSVKDWASANPDARAAICAKRRRADSKDLRWSYVVHQLKIPASLVTPELVELKRAQIILKRELRGK